eukprot:GFUD01099970.1.p1 GENE.GFUD01099970.1~~GFUD01099970.1.p1  ORF type:complete len:262 (+),score=74.20 GFUD01099970.1:154-939(+)
MKMSFFQLPLLFLFSHTIHGDIHQSSYQDSYKSWQELVTTRQSTTDSIQAIDLSIGQILDTLPGQVSTARTAVSDSVASSNRKSLSYGLGVAIGTVLGIQVALDGADLTTLSPQDWFYNAGTALYGYGFGAPYVLGGPLEDSDPGCGVAELKASLDGFPNLQNLGGTVYSSLAAADGTADPYTLVDSRHIPAVKVYDLQVMMGDLRLSLGCLLGSGDGAAVSNSLGRLEELISERLALTQRLIDGLGGEAVLANTITYSGV